MSLFFANSLPITTIRSMIPIGRSKDCVLIPKQSGKPYRIMQIIKDANTVPRILPFPPVDKVPPSTTAVMIDRVKVDPKSYLAESIFAVKSTPAIDAPILVKI